MINKEETISLFELVDLLWLNRKIIAIVTAFWLVLVTVATVFIVEPVYETNLNISISMPEVMNTKYGEFTMPMKTSLEYINLFTEQTVMFRTSEQMNYGDISIKEMRSKFSLPTKDSNIVNITVSENSPERAVSLANTAYENYTLYLDLILKNRALAAFQDKFNILIEQNTNQIDNLTKSLENDKIMLLNLTNQINSSVKNSNKYGVIDYVSLGQSLGYSGISTLVLQKEQQISQLQEDNALYEKYLEEITDMKMKIQAYKETGDKTVLESKNFDFVSQNIQLLSSPVVPKFKSGPNLYLNLFIGLMVGILFGVIFVLLKEYFFKKRTK